MPDWFVGLGSSIGFVIAFWVVFSLRAKKSAHGPGPRDATDKAGE